MKEKRGTTLKRTFQLFRHFVYVCLCNNQRWNKAQHISASRKNKKPIFYSLIDNLSHRSSRYYNALHQAFSSPLSKKIIFFHQFIQFLFQIRSYFLYMLQDFFLFKKVENFANCPAGKRISAVSSAMVSRYQRILGSFFHSAQKPLPAHRSPKLLL